ncbi:unnamed protein product [Psylliodes chrysocephalus]|uniref:Uncharacterized protein n=1 Tax=Psylliodes chrysocephalus TaxID=3402493 RepID=A0A9P0CU95_9CUCU|nr:unnamed protein product [Psylliodes chrysocephala]
MKGAFVIVLLLLGFAYAYDASFNDSIESLNVEIRQGGGIIEILSSMATLLKALAGILSGSTSAESLVSAIQGLFFAVERTLNIQGLVLKIPIVGGFIAPLVGGVSTIMQNTEMLSGLVSQVL